ncbi:fluoride efflux transporter CrcB [Fervidobacterium sp.]
MGSSFFAKILAVGTGGFIGSVLRYIISLWFNEKYPTSYIPYGTLVVNVIGSFLLGMIMEYATYTPMNATLRLFLTTGIMGGLTTFSTMSYETLSLLYSGTYGAAIINIAINIVLGLGSALGGKEVTDLFLML